MGVKLTEKRETFHPQFLKSFCHLQLKFLATSTFCTTTVRQKASISTCSSCSCFSKSCDSSSLFSKILFHAGTVLQKQESPDSGCFDFKRQKFSRFSISSFSSGVVNKPQDRSKICPVLITRHWFPAGPGQGKERINLTEENSSIKAIMYPKQPASRHHYHRFGYMPC